MQLTTLSIAAIGLSLFSSSSAQYVVVEGTPASSTHVTPAAAAPTQPPGAYCEYFVDSEECDNLSELCSEAAQKCCTNNGGAISSTTFYAGFEISQQCSTAFSTNEYAYDNIALCLTALNYECYPAELVGTVVSSSGGQPS